MSEEKSAAPSAGHTPTPWKLTGTRDINGHYLHIGAPSSATVLASMNATHPAVAANAAYIVRAVNAHAELVAALKTARNCMLLQHHIEEQRGIAWDRPIAVCDSALSKAES